MLKKLSLVLGCASSLLVGCGTPKLGLTEVCLISESVITCYDAKTGQGAVKSIDQLDQYTAFSSANASKINSYIDKCLKAGVRP